MYTIEIVNRRGPRKYFLMILKIDQKEQNPVIWENLDYEYVDQRYERITVSNAFSSYFIHTNALKWFTL